MHVYYLEYQAQDVSILFIFIQILSEFNRILQKDMVKCMQRRWSEIAPRVIQIASQEQSAQIRDVMADYPKDASDGMSLYI